MLKIHGYSKSHSYGVFFFLALVLTFLYLFDNGIISLGFRKN